MSSWNLYTYFNYLWVILAVLYISLWWFEKLGKPNPKSRTIIPQLLLSATILSLCMYAGLRIFSTHQGGEAEQAKAPSTPAVFHFYEWKRPCTKCDDARGKATEQSATMFFGFEETEMNPAIRNESLEGFEEFISGKNNCQLHIFGHADQVGPDARNRCYAAERALTLHSRLPKTVNNVTTRYYTCGEQLPMVDQFDPIKGEMVNRRAMAKVMCGEKMLTQPLGCEEFSVSNSATRTITLHSSGRTICE